MEPAVSPALMATIVKPATRRQSAFAMLLNGRSHWVGGWVFLLFPPACLGIRRDRDAGPLNQRVQGVEKQGATTRSTQSG